MANKRINNLNKQLAAAVDDFKQYHHNPTVAQLNKQLAAERAKVKTLLELLTRLQPYQTPDDGSYIADLLLRAKEEK